MITKEDDRVIVKEIVIIKDINNNDVQIYKNIEEYSQTRIDAEMVKLAELKAKEEHLQAIQKEMNKHGPR